MKLKELQELKNSVVADMKTLVEVEDNFDKAKFEAKEIELKEIEDKIESLEKVEKLTEVENKVEKISKEGERMEFKNMLLEGQEVRVDFKNTMTTANVELEKVANGQAVIEKAQENPILEHLRIERVNGTSIVPVSKQKMSKLVKAAELAEIAKSDILFSTVDLRPVKYSLINVVSEELLGSEAYNVEEIIVKEAREAIDDTIAELVITGDDTCFGLEKATAAAGAIEITRTAPNALTLDDINELYFGLAPKFRKTAVWVMNDATVRLLLTLQDSTGRPIVHQDLSKSFAFVLYGRPIVVSEDATKTYFADLAQAMVIGAGDTAQVKKSEDSHFTIGGVAFRTTTVIDIKPAIQKSIAYMA